LECVIEMNQRAYQFVGSLNLVINMFANLKLCSRPSLRCALCVAFVVVCVGPTINPTLATDVADYVAVLSSDASEHDKAMACHALLLTGNERAIDELAQLLDDERFATYARTALESTPSDAASTALRNALGRLQGDLRIGVINSIGLRRDALAIDLLAALIDEKDTATAGAAARALGKIGNENSAELLLVASLAGRSPEVQSKIAWACLECAMQCEKDGNREQSRRLYDAVRNCKLPTHIVLAATERLAETDNEQATKLLATAITSNDEQEFRAGLQMARFLDPKSTPIVLESFNDLSVERKLLTLILLGEQHDLRSLPIVLAAANHDDPRIRCQALASLGEFESRDAVPKLLDGLVDRDKSVSMAAREALADTQNKAVDSAIVDTIRQPTAAILPAAIEIARQRRVAAATAPLLEILKLDTSTEIRLAAIRALGSTIDLPAFPQLMDIALSANGDQRAAAGEALADACSRLPQQECAKQLIHAMEKVTPENRVMLLEQLTLVGDATALQAVVEAAGSDDENLQDAAMRLLGKWPTSEAANALYHLAQVSGPYQNRALRGYIRIARQLNMPGDERIRVCTNALQLAQRREEKELVLEALRRFPSAEGIVLASSLFGDEAVADSAISAIKEIAPPASRENPTAAAEALQLVSKSANSGQLAHLAVVSAACQEVAHEFEERNGFVSLFNSNSLDGWKGNWKIFRVEDGQIIGGNLSDRMDQNEFLVFHTPFDDFELRLQFKVIGDTANAGVQFRTTVIPGSNEVSGFQADLGPGHWGTLYDESRRRIRLAGPSEADIGKPVCPADWNGYRIRCQGDHIQIWINGVQTVDYTESDPSISKEGIVALQVHAGEPMEARYRNIRIKTLKH
jgi:HEAT repeat protein